MRINKIELNNFRIYKGNTTVEFPKKSMDKNVFLISGKNGFGKTSFLTSLVWCFYGQLMVQVEEKYKQDVKKYNGYPKFINSLVNKDVYKSGKRNLGSPKLMSVKVELNDVLIPSVPCKSVTIIREYNFESEKEKIKILIDGIENELTNEVGPEIFINDFILPREIAKFFFFDSEKIVSLAEAKSIEELRSLSKAYSEVLGIKKYEDLKANLKTLISKLKRSGASSKEKSKLTGLITRKDELVQLKSKFFEKIEDSTSILTALNEELDSVQEELIREGSGMSMEELNELKEQREVLNEKLSKSKEDLKEMMDLLPFYLAGKSFDRTYVKAANEQELGGDNSQKVEFLKELNQNLLDRLKNKFSQEIKTILDNEISTIIKETQTNNGGLKGAILLEQTPEQFRSFEGVYNHVKGPFSEQLEFVKKTEKDVRLKLTRTNNKIKQAESKKNDHIVENLKTKRDLIQSNSQETAQLIGELKFKLDSVETELTSTKKVLSELEKQYKVLETDIKKYQLTKNLLEKVEKLILKLKDEKKIRLEQEILKGLKQLMHKASFVCKVKVKIKEDIMDIELIDIDGNIINKGDLSKGEQQLYATAVLKALVEESGISFPVFIDSPLQKFDKDHSQKIIEEFYPSISDQVVVFPLLEKELNQEEYKILKPYLSGTYLIQNYDIKGSTIEKVALNQLFTKFNNQSNHVLPH